MANRTVRQAEELLELSHAEMTQVQGGESLVHDPVELESDPYQGKRSTGGYVPT